MILGFEGGGTRCSAAICDRCGNILGYGRAGPVNALFAGEETVRAMVRAAVGEALGEAGVSLAEIAAAYFAVPGTRAEVIRSGLAEAGCVPTACLCEGDDRAALHAGIAFGSGLVVLAGTGSFAIGKAEDGRIATAGGYGPVFGDEGSGYSIGRDALRCLGRVMDGLRPRTALTNRLQDVLEVAYPGDLRRLVYGSGFGRREIADLAREVAALAAAGDRQSAALLAKTGRDLAVLAYGLARQLGFSSRAFSVALTGGLRQAGPPLLEPFAASLRRLEPAARPIEPLLPPLGGALLLALKMLGPDPPPPVAATIGMGLCARGECPV